MSEHSQLLRDHYNNETKSIFVRIIIKYGRLPRDIALNIVEFLPLQSSFTQFNPTWCDGCYSLIQLILIITNNLIHYGIVGYLSISNSLLFRFMMVLPLIESILIMYLYYSNIKFIRTNNISNHALAFFAKLHSFLEIFCYSPMIIFLIIIHQTQTVENNVGIFLISSYFLGYIIMEIYQNIQVYRIKILNKYMDGRFVIFTRYYSLFQCWLLLIYGIITQSSIILIMAISAFYICLLFICKTLNDHWFHERQPKYVIMIYIQNICFGIFSMQLLFKNCYDDTGFIIICIVFTFLQSINCVLRHFIDEYRVSIKQYMTLCILPDVLINISILNLSLYVLYTVKDDNRWNIIWYINMIILLIALVIKDIYLYIIGNFDTKPNAELVFNLIEHGVYALIFGIWGVIYLSMHSIDASHFLGIFASISTSIGSIGLCSLCCCVYFGVQDLNKPPGMYPYGYMS